MAYLFKLLNISQEAVEILILLTVTPFKRFKFLGQDTRIRLHLEPSPGDPGYIQWKDAMKMVARLPEGVPQEFRRKVRESRSTSEIISLEKIHFERSY